MRMRPQEAIASVRRPLAIWLRDMFDPERRPVGDVEVCVPGHPWKATPGLGRCRLFPQLPAGRWIVAVRSMMYLEAKCEVALSDEERGAAIATIPLMPAWLYPFPEGVTLVRGLVCDARQDPVSGARVVLADARRETSTTRDGHFVLFLVGLTDDRIATVERRRLVTNEAGGTRFRLRVTAAGFKPRTVPIGPVQEGATYFLKAPLVLRDAEA